MNNNNDKREFIYIISINEFSEYFLILIILLINWKMINMLIIKIFPYFNWTVFKFPQNNIYQNIAHEIIKIFCLEECPYYFVEPFLIINNEKKTRIISNLIY